MNININELEDRRVVIKTMKEVKFEIIETSGGQIILSVSDIGNVLKITPMAINSIMLESVEK